MLRAWERGPRHWGQQGLFAGVVARAVRIQAKSGNRECALRGGGQDGWVPWGPSSQGREVEKSGQWTGTVPHAAPAVAEAGWLGSTMFGKTIAEARKKGCTAAPRPVGPAAGQRPRPGG